MGVVDLLVLIAPQIDHAQAVLLALEQVVELFLRVAPAGVGFGDGVRREAAEAVEEDALLGLVEAAEALALGVDQGQLGGKLAENGDGGRLVVDEDAALAGGEDFAAQNDVVAAGVDAVFFQDGLGVGRGFKDAGHDGLVGAVADHSAEDLPPMSRASASTRMDLPAPVSPVSRLRPGPKLAMA
jgi:hypothetical protein